MKLKSTCCEKYARKAKACKGCPLMARLSKKNRRQRLEAARKRSARAS